MEKRDFRLGNCPSWMQKLSGGTLTASVVIGCSVIWASVIGLAIL